MRKNRENLFAEFAEKSRKTGKTLFAESRENPGKTGKNLFAEKPGKNPGKTFAEKGGGWGKSMEKDVFSRCRKGAKNERIVRILSKKAEALK